MRRGLTCAVLLAFGLAAVVPGLLAAKPVRADDSLFQPQPFTMNGTVSKVDVDRDRVTFTGDDGRRYTLDTSQCDITLPDSNRAGLTADLVPGNRVHVVGHLLSSSIAEVDQLRVLDDAPRPTTRATRPRTTPQEVYGASVPIDFRGTVDSIDTDRGAFVVRVKDHSRTVLLADNTDVAGMHLPDPSLFPVKSGDRVTVAGFLQPDGNVLAGVVSLSRTVALPPAPAVAPRPPSLVGRVSSTSNRYTGRDIKIRLNGNGREVKIKVPHGVVIRREGRAISVHDLSGDDVVRVMGAYDGNDFRATRIDVLGSASEAGRSGFSRL